MYWQLHYLIPNVQFAQKYLNLSTILLSMLLYLILIMYIENLRFQFRLQKKPMQSCTRIPSWYKQLVIKVLLLYVIARIPRSLIHGRNVIDLSTWCFVTHTFSTEGFRISPPRSKAHCLPLFLHSHLSVIFLALSPHLRSKTRPYYNI